MEDVRLIRYHGDLPGVDSYTADLPRDKQYHDILQRKKMQKLLAPINPIRFKWEKIKC
jgi:hypothetical protein